MNNEILKKIIQVSFPENQYIPEETKKTQIFLHHTVSPRDSAENVVDYWEQTKERVATAIVLNGDGIPYQLYSTKYWGYHLGLETEIFKLFGLPYKSLDKNSIGVEICSWGGLCQHTNGNWYPSKWDKVTKKIVANTSIDHIPTDQVWIPPSGKFKGFKGFHKYSDEQIESLRQLLLLWNERWGIPLTYNEDIFEINEDALSGIPGVYTHCSVNKGKSDIFPQDEMITMLKSL